MFFEDGFQRATPFVEDACENEKARATRDDRQHDEQDEIVIKRARHDGDKLIGDGRQPFDEDEPRAPFGVKFFQRWDAIGIAIEIE